MKSNQLASIGGIALILCLGLGQLVAQDTPPPGGDRQGRGGNRGGRGGGNFDPAQFQQRAMENLKEQMKVKDDAEWKVLETRIQTVMDTQREIGFGGGLRRLFRRPGGDNNNGDQGGGRRGGFGPEPSAEEQALDKAIDSGASKDELKSAMAKYRAAKKAKEEKLTTAQEELKKVLTPQQEAVALAVGLVR